MKNFWLKLPKPFFVLAPMADVTDASFRQVIAKYGKPDVMYTEFVSADGFFLGGREALVKDLLYTEKERPIVAQFFSTDPQLMKRASALANKLGFDGVDINMGCPDKNVCKQGAGAAMIKTPKLAREIIRATKEGAGNLPVSVKTRAGYSKDEELEPWLSEILKEEPATLILHARTKKNMSKVPARWQLVKRAVQLRDEMSSQTLIVGNGDIWNLADGQKKAQESGCDGVMMGRAIFGNPWLFDPTTNYGQDVALKQKLKVLVEHTNLFEKIIGDRKNFAIMKKHFKAYVTGWDGAKELRSLLMATGSAKEVKVIINDFLKQHLK